MNDDKFNYCLLICIFLLAIFQALGVGIFLMWDSNGNGTQILKGVVMICAILPVTYLFSQLYE